MVKRAALILAGGQARRFQSRQPWQDKALATLEGKPMLVHAVQNVKPAVDEVIVCANVESRRELYARTLREWRLEAQVVVDQKVGHVSGPVIAILTGLKAANADLCFTLPCDMPLMQAAVVDYLFGLVEDVDVVVPMWPNGRLETLVTVIHRQTAMEVADALCQLKRARADDMFRGTQKIMFTSPVTQIKALDPELKSFVNINAPKDLTELPTRQTQGTITQNMKVNISTHNMRDLQNLKEAAKLRRQNKKAQAADLFSVWAGRFEREDSFFWAALARENQADVLQSLGGLGVEAKAAYMHATEDYRLEAGMHEQNNCKLLSERALGDSLWCSSQAARQG
ncbi:MAG: molybdenum cofactor guanylyltransferase [Candidatus Bathyarchaeota archaeon]|nr:molybdenum cofactor guanylyltransferase [Candidatus Bathyarchaeota archaeon]